MGLLPTWILATNQWFGAGKSTESRDSELDYTAGPGLAFARPTIMRSELLTTAGRALETERYQFLDLLGRGGMGEVYRGRALGFGGFEKIVAIKRLLPELGSDARFVDRMVGEAKLLVSLQHSNLVSVLDLGRFGDEVFMVLEYVDGPSLHALLKAYARAGHLGLPLGLVSYIGQGACAGVEFAHDQPSGAVIHADLSPANVLVSRAGEIKVADFGIARREGAPHRSSMIEGKWPYMSPEQVLGDPLTPASDIFSMGIVLYQLATGALPFTGRDRVAVASAIIEGRVERPRRRRADIPPALEQVILRALARNPAERFPRMGELGSALRAVSFAEGWRDGADDLARAVREHFPPRLPTDEDVREVLVRLGIDDVARDATPPVLAPREPPPCDMTGTVVLRRLPSPGGVAQWAVREPTAPPRAPAWRRRLSAAAALAAFALAVTWAVASGGARPRTALLVPAPEPTAEPPAPTPIVEPLPDPQPVRPERSEREASAESTPPVRPERRARKARPESKDRRSPSKGTLRLHSEPWAYVWVDGHRKRYETPLELQLPAGKHRLRLENPEAGLSRREFVHVRADDVTTVRVELAP